MDNELKHALQEADDVLHDLIGFLARVGKKSPLGIKRDFADALQELSAAASSLRALEQVESNILEFPKQPIESAPKRTSM